MANKYRGEIAATLDGAPYTLCLTLGALAELESAFGSDDMLSLAARFTQGRISATDCVRIIGAGLRGAGHDIADEGVTSMRADNGAAGFIDIVARLLAATFGGPIAGAAANVALDAIEGAVTTMAKAEAPAQRATAAIPLVAPLPPRPFILKPDPPPRAPFRGPRS